MSTAKATRYLHDKREDITREIDQMRTNPRNLPFIEDRMQYVTSLTEAIVILEADAVTKVEYSGNRIHTSRLTYSGNVDAPGGRYQIKAWTQEQDYGVFAEIVDSGGRVKRHVFHGITDFVIFLQHMA